MAKRIVSFETYRKRNITHAANKLYPEAAKALKRAFAATNCMDIYGGELHTYLNVIADRLESANAHTTKMKEFIGDAKKFLEKIC
jgi:hypothetical protein